MIDPAHDSDCAMYNDPAMPIEKCNCSVMTNNKRPDIERLLGDGLPLSRAVAAYALDLEKRIAALLPIEEERNRLIMAVGNKYTGETRFETALRIIQQNQRATSEPCAAREAVKASKEGGGK